jgi:hypothetical protein
VRHDRIDGSGTAECNDVPRHLSTVSRDITTVGPVGLEPTIRGEIDKVSEGVCGRLPTLSGDAVAPAYWGQPGLVVTVV